MRSVRILLWLPLIAFLIVFGLVMTGLIRPHSTDISSQMIGKPLPAFDLPPVRDGDRSLTSASLATGTPHLVNVFASWCIPCAQEAPQMQALKQAGVPIVGIAISDKVPDTRAFLAQYGDPYAAVGRDDHAAVQLALGSSGVPESFVVDGKGIIRLQHIGDIRPEQIDDILAAMKDAGQ